MPHLIRVGAYVKLAKLWERRREEATLANLRYHAERCAEAPNLKLEGVYIDITGKSDAWDRPRLLCLLKACRDGRIDLITSRTKAYFAANAWDFCCFTRYLFSLEPWIDLLTEDEDYNINTLENRDGQREALEKMALDYTRLDPKRYKAWREKVETGIGRLDAEYESKG